MHPSENETDIAIRADHLNKAYQVYKKPMDRLYQAMWRGRKTYYRAFHALNDVSFTVHRNETLGIIGSNGSGKSTLLRMMCGILTPTAGTISVNGRVTALLELGAGFNPEFTGRENVYLNAAIMGLSGAETDNRYEAIASFADIGAFIDQPVKTYSSGMYVRLAFAVAVHVSPDILLIDEALSVGDLRFQQKCMARIKDFCESGTVVFVSHNMAVVTELCSRVLWIDGGCIQMDGAPKYVVEKYIEHTYGDKSQPAPLAAHDAGGQSLDGFSPVDEDIRQFGNRRVLIKAVKMATDGQPNRVLYADQPCTLQMVLHAREPLSHPIVGYTVKDRIGRIILGENTRVMGASTPSLEKGKDYLVTFDIDRWPNIMGGDYSLSIAVADGSQEDVVQCHWLNDALILSHMHTRPPVGIFTVPDTSVVFRKL